MIDLSIIIVSANSAHFLLPCLQSIYSNPPQIKTEVWLVDNQSTDGTRQVALQFPEVNLVVNRERYSFAHNNNIGILLSTGRYILLLNPDTEVRQDALDIMVDFMNSHQEAGACGPKLLNPDGSLQPSCRRFPTPLAVLSRGTLLHKMRPFKYWHEKYLMSNWDHASVRGVDWVMGACLLVRRETVADVGLLDEAFRMYYEDIDWCYRIRQRGWKIYYVPRAQVMHHYQRTSAASFNRKTLFHIHSILRYFWKHRLNHT